MNLFSYSFLADKYIYPNVVGRQDTTELNFMIDVIMERHGIRASLTAKQGSKDLARGGRTRHEGF